MDIRQENALERSLRLAADQPVHRPEFLQMLLNSTIYVLGSARPTERAAAFEGGSQVALQQWKQRDGTPIIPFFSSLEALQNTVETEQSYLALSAKSLFEMTLGATLLLNPNSRYAKTFVPNEVRHLLSHGAGQPPAQRIVQQESQVLLGQPTRYPSRMVDALTLLLAKHSNVSRAFLALMFDPSVDDKPHLVIGIEADGDIQLVLREAGSVAADTVPDGEPVDLCRVSENDAGLSRYFLSQTKPFYDRKLETKLRSFLGLGKTS